MSDNFGSSAAAQTMTAAPRAPRGLVGRLVGLLTSPRDTYAEIVAPPRWLGVGLIVLLLNFAPAFVLLSTTIGQRALLDQQVQTVEGFGRPVTDGQYQALRRFIPYAPYFAAGTNLLLLPTAALVIAGVAAGVFGGLMGGNARFAQVFTVVVGSGAVLALRTLFSVPLDYARETLSSPTTLSAALPFFEDNTFAARALGSIDLFVIWWILNLSIGLAILYKRRTTPIATTLIVVYCVIGLTVAIVRSMLSGA